MWSTQNQSRHIFLVYRLYRENVGIFPPSSPILGRMAKTTSNPPLNLPSCGWSSWSLITQKEFNRLPIEANGRNHTEGILYTRYIITHSITYAALFLLKNIKHSLYSLYKFYIENNDIACTTLYLCVCGLLALKVLTQSLTFREIQLKLKENCKENLFN